MQFYNGQFVSVFKEGLFKEGVMVLMLKMVQHAQDFATVAGFTVYTNVTHHPPQDFDH